MSVIELDLTPETRTVLVSAIAFRLRWAERHPSTTTPSILRSNAMLPGVLHRIERGLTCQLTGMEPHPVLEALDHRERYLRGRVKSGGMSRTAKRVYEAEHAQVKALRLALQRRMTPEQARLLHQKDEPPATHIFSWAITPPSGAAYSAGLTYTAAPRRSEADRLLDRAVLQAREHAQPGDTIQAWVYSATTMRPLCSRTVKIEHTSE